MSKMIAFNINILFIGISKIIIVLSVCVSVNSSFSDLSFSKLKTNGCFLLPLFTEYVADKLYKEFFNAIFSFSKVSTFCFKIFDSFNNLFNITII